MQSKKRRRVRRKTRTSWQGKRSERIFRGTAREFWSRKNEEPNLTNLVR